MKIKLGSSDHIVILLIFYWAVVSFFELITYSNARYLRLSFLFVIFIEYFAYFVKNRIDKQRLTRIWLLSIPVVIYSVFFNFDITNAEYLITYIFAVLLLALKLKTPEKTINKCCNIVLVAGVIQAAGVIGELLFQNLFNTYIYTRYPAEMYARLSNHIYYTGFQREVAVVSAYIIAGLGVSLFICQKNYKSKLISIFLLIALVVTNKRAYIIFPVMAIVIELLWMNYSAGKIWAKRTTFPKYIIMISMSVLLIFVFWNSIYNIPIVQRIGQTITAFVSGEDATTGRGVLWLASWQLFLQKPILGIGWRNTERYIRLIVYSSVELSTHNVYLQLLTETGIVGGIIFLIAFVYSVYIISRVYKNIKQKKLMKNRNVCYYRFSTYYQIFFLLYCITGVNMQDKTYMIIYFFSIFIFKYRTLIESHNQID